jgi:hypothetical protein
MTIDDFADLRYGLFVHYGLYSLLGRGEWARNREAIPREEYTSLAEAFGAERFDADSLCRLALDAGMRYIVFTTMHHDGFRLYGTKLSGFCTMHTPCGRDLVAEVVEAARRHGLGIGLYHSLNNWHDQPDAVDALERPEAYERFIAQTLARIEELVRRFNPIDLLWYDGWWPFDARGWQAERMNAMVKSIQPHILFNGRNGLPGDFATPEQHLVAPSPWRPWEACITLNNSWGYHAGDDDWKTPGQVIDLLAACANGGGNLLLNIGPRGDGSVPEASQRILREVGAWLRGGGAEAIFGTDRLATQPSWPDPEQPLAQPCVEWNHHGPMTVKGDCLYLILRRPAPTVCLAGLSQPPVEVTLLSAGGARPAAFSHAGGWLRIDGLDTTTMCPVLRLRFPSPPTMYQCGGMRVPRVRHPHYDPIG